MITDDKEKKQPKEKGAFKEDRRPRKAGYFLEGFSAYYYTPICSLIRGLFTDCNDEKVAEQTLTQAYAVSWIYYIVFHTNLEWARVRRTSAKDLLWGWNDRDFKIQRRGRQRERKKKQ